MAQIINLTGQVFNKLTVIKFSHSNGNAQWLCLCECGKEVVVSGLNLKTGNTKTCGCSRQEGKCFHDITGKKFNRLTALSVHSKAKNKNTRTNWNCICDCGTLITVESSNLKSGHTKSCGCVLIEAITIHGLATKNRRLYGIWLGMLARCYKKNIIGYKNYGGRGIIVHADWHYPVIFGEWAFSNGYADNLTLERINVNGIYEPNNCEWIPLKYQNQNTTKSLGKEKVLKIRQLLSEGITPKEISITMGCAYTTIISIKNFENYKDFLR